MTDPLRLMVVRDHLVWSGGTIYFHDTLPRLDPDRIAAHLAVLEPPRPGPDPFAKASIFRTHLSGGWRDPGSLRALGRLIGSVRPDVLWLSGPRAMLSGSLAGRSGDAALVPRFNNALPDRPWRLWLQRRLAHLPAAGIAVSRAMAAWAARTYRLPRSRIQVIYSGRDLAPFGMAGADRGERRRRIRQELGLDHDARVVLLAGRVVDAQKGQMGAIGALGPLRERVPAAHLLVVGDGPDLEACRALASARDLGGAVTFTGLRRDMPDLLAASDVAIVPSLVAEAFGFAAIEASAAGLPVVAFDSGGLGEAVLDGRTGLLVPRGDWAALTDAVAACLTDPGRAAAKGAAGRSFASRFSIDAHVEALSAFFETLVGRKAGDPAPALAAGGP